MSRTIMLLYGTRPEAIKMAPLVRALQESPGFDPYVAVTGQHREMLDQVNELFEIVPDHDMQLMAHGASLDQIAAAALTASARAIELAEPDAVVVQGDTASAFVGGLAAFYHGVPVVHLEAGLRTGDMTAPFPEEANRRLLAPITSLHLAPTSRSKSNLLREGIDPDSVVVTGNTVIDALQTAADIHVSFSDPRVQRLLDRGSRVLLVTAHRRESWGHRMQSAMDAVAGLARQYTDLVVLLPMHRNQIVRDVIEPALADLDNIVLTEPLSYHEFVHALNCATVVLTDSGGVQEEAPSLGKPVLVMRDTTERPEAVEAGTVKVVGTDADTIRGQVTQLLDDPVAYQRMANAVNPYGDGHAAERSMAALKQLFGLGTRLPDFTAL